MRLRSKLVRQLRYPVRWLSFLASGVPVILIFPAPSLSYLAWFALVPAMVLFTRAATTREAVARGWWFGAALPDRDALLDGDADRARAWCCSAS